MVARRGNVAGLFFEKKFARLLARFVCASLPLSYQITKKPGGVNT